MPVFRITHLTTYRHAAHASVTWQVFHLQPRSEKYQDCLEFELDIAPNPSNLAARTDVFGNTRHIFSSREPHAELSIGAQSLVWREEPDVLFSSLMPSITDTVEGSVAGILGGDFALEQFRLPSPLVPLVPEAKALAEGLDGEKLSATAWMEKLGERFAEHFTFDSSATTISTPLRDVVKGKRGVCQDFAQLYISCARQHGLAAAYVSGYLLTEPPPGKPRLLGVDASHAWVSIFVPGFGWIDYDPTNHCFAGAGHIVVARGRDYTDVSPTRGLFSSGGGHRMRTAVTVEVVETGFSGL